MRFLCHLFQRDFVAQVFKPFDVAPDYLVFFPFVEIVCSKLFIGDVLFQDMVAYDQ